MNRPHTLLGQLNVLDDHTGGEGGTPFTDRLLADEYLTEVSLCYTASIVQSVRLRTSAGLRPRHGAYVDSPSVKCDVQAMQNDPGQRDFEYITQVFGRAGSLVNSLGYVTNKGRRIGPFPANVTAGKEFSQSLVTRGRMAGLYGRSGGSLDKIGLLGFPAGDNSQLVPNAPIQSFSDQLNAGEAIGKVEVCWFHHNGWNADVIRSVQAFTVSGRALPVNGGRRQEPAQCQQVAFAPNEFITEMFGKAGGAIDSLGFRTSTGREVGPFGGAGGTPYVLRNPSSSSFLGFAGRYVYDGALTVLDIAAPDLFAPVALPGAAAATQGWWDDLVGWPINAIHASVLGDGRVLTYGTEGGGAQGGFVYDVWTPPALRGAGEHLTLDNRLGTDIFCSAQTLFASGTVLLAGGDNRREQRPGYDGFNKGVKDANLFYPGDNTLKPTGNMSRARWYATQTMLPSGRVLVVGGRDEGDKYVNEVELYTPNVGWKTLTGAADNRLGADYPRVFVAPRGAAGAAAADGVYVIPTGTGPGEGQVLRLRVDANGGLGKTESAGSYGATHDWQRPAVMYRPGKVLLSVTRPTGANTVDFGAHLVITLPEAGNATAVATASISQARRWSSFTLLPTGEVLATDGAEGDTRSENPLEKLTQYAQIWNPATGAWRNGAGELRPRLYHSTAVLLQDGRVLSAGGGSPGPVTNLNAQLYSPPYLFAGGNGAASSRPVLNTAITSLVPDGGDLSLQTPQAADIAKATLTRLGSTTHSFDFDSRLLELQVRSRVNGQSVTVAKPANKNATPPGKYLLTLVNGQGVPSVSRVVTVN